MPSLLMPYLCTEASLNWLNEVIMQVLNLLGSII
jgi:hypothetical protein